MTETPRDSIEKARAELGERDAIIADRDAKIAKLESELTMLRSEFERFLRGRNRGITVPEGQGLLFAGPSSDVAEASGGESDDAASTDDEDDQEDAESPPRKRKRPARARKIDTAGLPRETQLHELPEDERVCPVTGLAMVPVSEKVTEELDYRRAKLVVIEHRQVIYGLSPEDAKERQADPLAAPVPSRPIPNCIASAMLLAWLLVQKFANHLPLYRQQAIFGRDGLRLPRQTLCDWTLAAAEALEPIVQQMLTRARAGPILQIDDTPVQCQGGRGESNFQARLWAFVNPTEPGIVYRFTPGRAAATLADELGDFAGTLVGDGYSGNRAAAGLVVERLRQADSDVEIARIVLAGCWAHVARKFRDAANEARESARLFRDDIRELYDVEQEVDGIEVDNETDRASLRLGLRKRKSLPVVIRILRRTSRMRSDFDKAGLMGEAMRYVRNQRPLLVQFLRDGNVPIDNNACERSIRPIAVGRRNWLFAGSMRGGRAAATIYSLVESCRLADVDPIDYLADVLGRVRHHEAGALDELTPVNWRPLAAPTPPKARAPAPCTV